MNHNHIDWNDIELVSSFTVTTKVKFAQLIYVKTGEPMDKAGSYGNLGIGGQIIERMERGAFAVVILLMHRLSFGVGKSSIEPHNVRKDPINNTS